jgi:tRNA (guanine37-N1)-methyltransferase
MRRSAAGEGVDEVIFLTPDGEVLNQSMCGELSMKRHVVMIAGHYKGIDQRVRDALVTREISIGDYVLSGGELPALVLVDAMVRLVPGVLGDEVSALSDSFMDGLLDAPAYTRPGGIPRNARTGRLALGRSRPRRRMARRRTL